MSNALDALLGRIDDPALQGALSTEIQQLRSIKSFGLVFERHIPETARLASYPIKRGVKVQERRTTKSPTWLVIKLDGDAATLLGADGEKTTRPVDELVVVRDFGDAIYPGLRTVGRVERGGDRAFHTVLNAENYHALELLLWLYPEQFDCIYIDPPYNTGARDWKYNNDYVDLADFWRHSKWLSMMEKRLKLAKDLLKPDGVLIVTIDEHEVNHLGVLLEELMAEARRQVVTIVNNAAGVSQGGFYRVEENAFFCFFGNARPVPAADDLLSDEKSIAAPPMWFSLNRYGGSNSVPARRPGLVYPIAIDPERLRVVGMGKTLTERRAAGEDLGDLTTWRPDPEETVDGYPVIWPYRADGSVSTWQVMPETLREWAASGFVRIREQSNGSGGNRWSVSYVRSGNQKKVLKNEIPTSGREPDDGPYIFGSQARQLPAKTVWKRARHDAGKWGSRVLKEFVPGVSFDYPKSPYAVLDTLASVVGDKPDALVCDFFAGSGTTLHSTLLLNSEDGGNRRCILVTNNEVEASRATALQKEGVCPGQPEYEKYGIFEAVTRPRIEAAVRGAFADGKPVEGSYLNSRDYSAGFAENVEFCELSYLDRDVVSLGRAFHSLAPILWMKAGSCGPRIEQATKPFALLDRARYAILFDVAVWRTFVEALAGNSDLTHVFVVTDSLAQFQQIVSELPPSLEVSMLYEDYLRSFDLNGRPG
jgi:adenine-specific DNA-methyltransferase